MPGLVAALGMRGAPTRWTKGGLFGNTGARDCEDAPNDDPTIKPWDLLIRFNNH